MVLTSSNRQVPTYYPNRFCNSRCPFNFANHRKTFVSFIFERFEYGGCSLNDNSRPDLAKLAIRYHEFGKKHEFGEIHLRNEPDGGKRIEATLTRLRLYADNAPRWAAEASLLRRHVAIEPAVAILLRLIMRWRPERELPFDETYMIGRYQGLHMLTIVCSVLFPLGLAGLEFSRSGDSVAIVILVTLYAELLKLSLVDTRLSQEGMPSQLHPLR